MHEEPINLTRLFFRTEFLQWLSQGLRITGSGFNFTSAETQSNSRFSVSRTVYNGKETYTPAVYKFDLDTRSQYLPEMMILRSCAERDQLLLRVLNDDAGFTVLNSPYIWG